MPNILNQDEIDSLMGAMESGELDEQENEDTSSQKMKEYNFRRPNLITKDQLRNFETIHETFSKEMSSALALMMRINTEFSLVSTEQQQYGEFIESLPKVSHILKFSTEELPGVALIEMNLSLAFGIIDILLGGEGEVATEIRVPTDIEISIMAPFMEKILERLQFCWISLMAVKIKQEGVESDPEYVQAAPTDAPVVILSFDVKLGNANGIINICYPMPMIQAVNEYLDGVSGQMDSYYGKKADDKTRAQVFSTMLDIPMPFKVELGGARLKGRELMDLSTGDVLILDTKINELLTMKISGREVYKIKPGKIKDELYARLVKQVHLDDPDQEINISLKV